jgi:predicted DsbA family dithiol-disulfide isomerase
MPPEGVAKNPPTPGNPRVGGGLKAAGEAVGIDFTGACDRAPNTLQAHALLEYVLDNAGATKQNEVAELIFKGYFTDGDYPDTKFLVKVAESVGLNGSDVKKVITDQSKLDAAHENARNASRKGVTGVPCFFMNGQRTFSGAQDAQQFVKAFTTIAERYPMST